MIIRSILTIAVLGSFVFGAAANAQTITENGMIGDPISFTVDYPTEAGGVPVVTWLISGDDTSD